MFKQYEIEGIVKNSLLELDGLIDKKSNEDGTHDIYFVEILGENQGEMLVQFQTNIGENAQIDKYRIKVEYVPN